MPDGYASDFVASSPSRNNSFRNGQKQINTLKQKQNTERIVMNKKLRITACAVFLALLSVSVAQAEDDIQAQSQQAIANFKAKDTSLATFFANSAGYAVFPEVGKG